MALLCTSFWWLPGPAVQLPSINQDLASTCVPPKKLPLDAEKTNFLLNDADFRSNISTRLSKAVQIDTTVDDNQQNFTKFSAFHEYLRSEFASVFEAANVDVVNEYGLVLEFVGSDTTLKPIMLMAHQDTVPIGDKSLWERSPWSGYIDDKFVWGRGSADTKASLISELQSMELLLDSGFKPTRTIVLAFGFDEEILGRRGALQISEFLVKKYGENSLSLILDEGIGLYMPFGDVGLLLATTAEKGYMDLAVEAHGVLGHSSSPPKHTSIGILSRFISAYDFDEYPWNLVDDSPMIDCLECLGKYSKALPKELKRLISRARKDPAARNIAWKSIFDGNMLRWGGKTSRAIDVISGGNKINALPGSTTVKINHRILYGESLEYVLNTTASYAKQVAEDLGVGLTVNGTEIYPDTDQGGLEISVINSFAPSKKTPINDYQWNTYMGYGRSLFEDYVFKDLFSQPGKELSASQFLATFNTDTHWMWPLSDHIYRVSPYAMIGDITVHAPNEHMSIDGLTQMAAFYFNFLPAYCGKDAQ